MEKYERMGMESCHVFPVIVYIVKRAYDKSPIQYLLHTVRRYFQHAYFIPIVGVGKKGAYQLVHGDLPRQHSFRTVLRFTGPVPADSRQ